MRANKARQVRPKDTRLSSWRRGYDTDWYKVRDRKLAIDPLCQDCLNGGVVTVAVEVHHIVKVLDNSELRLDINNLMSLCKSCHSQRTARGE